MALATRRRRVEFKTGRVIRGLRNATSKALDVVVVRMTKAVQSKLGNTFPPPSRAGQYPRKRTGNLQNTIAVRRKGRALFVSTPQYGIWLQHGTRKMRARKLWQEVLFSGGKGIQRQTLKPVWRKQINAQIRKFTK